MALFRRFIEPGRLCVVQYGPDEGKVSGATRESHFFFHSFP